MTRPACPPHTAFVPAAVIDALEADRIEFFTAGPSLIDMLVAEIRRRERADLSHLREIAYATAPITPSSLTAAVLGRPDPTWGEAVHAVIMPVAGPAGQAIPAEEIMAWCRDQLAHFKCPKSVESVILTAAPRRCDPARPRQSRLALRDRP